MDFYSPHQMWLNTSYCPNKAPLVKLRGINSLMFSTNNITDFSLAINPNLQLDNFLTNWQTATLETETFCFDG